MLVSKQSKLQRLYSTYHAEKLFVNSCKSDSISSPRGATSVVFRCEEKQTEKFYASKILKKTVSSTSIVMIFKIKASVSNVFIAALDWQENSTDWNWSLAEALPSEYCKYCQTPREIQNIS